ncbi:MAG: Uma2 family endonuclease [Anaerolineae bacterium]
MSTQPHERIGMSLEEFLAEGAKHAFELINGERLERMPNVYGHRFLIRWMLRQFEAFLASSPLGDVDAEVTYTVSDSAQWVQGSRIPDLAFFGSGRLAQYMRATPEWWLRPLRLVPDLTVELVSPSEKADDTAKKIAADLANGVREVWVIDMTTQAAHIHTPNGVTAIAPDGALTTPLLPAFELRLPDLFAALDEV